MSHVLICTLRANAMPYLKALRLDHLEYIASHRNDILFGGPARNDDGTPETMIIVLKTDDAAAAQTFIDGEPYSASGHVFSGITVRPWTQVLPDLTTGALGEAIAAERQSRLKEHG